MRPIATNGVAWSVCRSVIVMSPAKTAEPIEMLFVLKTRVRPRNLVLNGSPDPLWKGAILIGEGATHCKVQGQSALW